MARGPFIFVSVLKIKEGKLDEFKENVKKLVEVVETNEPRLISFNLYVDEAGEKTTLVQVHPDAASMGFHMGVVAEHMSGAFEFLEEESAIIAGADSDGVLDQIKQWTAPEVRLTVTPIHAGGFTRATGA